MRPLRRVRIEIPGHWRDAWLYKEYLLLWTRSGDILWYEHSRLLRDIESLFGRNISVLVEYLILRNDWKVDASFRRLCLVPGVLESFLQDHPGDDEELVLRMPIDPEYLEFEIPSGVNLDNYLYANRLYMGTTEGLFQSYFNPKHPDSRQVTIQHLDTRISRVCARYSSLHASAEQAGLWFDRIFIGDADWTKASHSLQRIADESISAAYSIYNILNYTSEPVPGFLRARIEKGRTHDRAQYEEKMVIGYGREESINELTKVALLTGKKIDKAQAERLPPLEYEDDNPMQVLGNSGKHMLVYWGDQLSTVRIEVPRNGAVQAKRGYTFGRAHDSLIARDDILNTYPLEGGFVVELYDEVRYLAQNGSFLLYDGPAARIRTFPQAKRHKEAIVVVAEESANIIGFIEAVLP